MNRVVIDWCINFKSDFSRDKKKGNYKPRVILTQIVSGCRYNFLISIGNQVDADLTPVGGMSTLHSSDILITFLL